MVLSNPNIIKAATISETENKHKSICVSIVRMGDRSESFLARCVPDLKIMVKYFLANLMFSQKQIEYSSC